MPQIFGHIQAEGEDGNRLNQLESFPPFGRVLKDLKFTANVERRVYHGLKREPNGYILIQTDQEAAIYESSVSGTPRDFLLMKHHASNASTVTVWFF